jgi:hypothetical protein
VTADVGEEELKAVGRTRDLLGRLEPGGLLLGGGLLGVRRRRRVGGRCRRPDLEPDPLELRGQLFDLLVVQVELDGECLQLRRLEIPALLRPLDQSARLVGLEQLVQLVLRQVSSVLSGPCVDWVNEPSHSTREVLSLPGGSFGLVSPRLRTVAATALFRGRRLRLGLLRLRADREVELDLSLLV